ncbi:MAG: DUF1553 domain-containing protein [Rubripirellula sp.]
MSLGFSRSRPRLVLSKRNRFVSIWVWGLSLCCLFASTTSKADAPNSVDFFENRIRPVLAKHCYECHSADAEEVGGALLLDSRDGMMSGGDSGPAVDPGNVDASVLISAIRYESSEMPPQGKLPDTVIQDFERWIKAGAVDPRKNVGGAVQKTSMSIDLDAGRSFWAFQPTAVASVPRSLSGGARGMIDQFLNERLEAEGVTPNSLADPETRLRRLSFDLTGLPPNESLQSRWLQDPSRQQWTRIVDELLASPAFAEHWARHWMDVARYADSNGSDFNATHHEAWRYRDYLIRSYATDRAIDEMIRQQIAGDLLPAVTDAERYDNIVATTFLMLGTKMLSERDKAKLELDVIDEQIDTVGRAFLGLTLGCARCHDHKFDPVPTEDYYALAGIFKSTRTLNGESQKYVSTWNRVLLPSSQQHRDEVKQHAGSVRELKSKLSQAERSLKSIRASRTPVLAGVVVDDAQAEKKGVWKSSVLMKDFVGEGYIHDNNTNKGDASIRFATRLPSDGEYEVRISHSPGSTRASQVPVTIETADGPTQVAADQRKVQVAPMWTSLGTFRFSSEMDAVVTMSNAGTSGYVIADAVQFLPVEDSATHLAAEDRELGSSAEEQKTAIETAQAKVDLLKKELAALVAKAPEPLPEAMAPSDHATAKVVDSPVHIRGEVKNLGAIIPRGFLQVCSSGDASIRSPEGSGRLQLADWLTDPDNPLVARVYVNRVWSHLMGEGIVRTVDNFGQQGERPSHPELMDAIASEFVRGGWRTKSLVRAIVLSDAYVRSSDYQADSVQRDPENRLWWRMHRRRLPAESIRDAMLTATGTLDRTARFDPMRGRGTLVSSNNGNSTASFDDVSQSCRSIYLPVVRGYMPAMMTALDVADPDLLVGRRPTTNVPSQALVLINSPDVNQWSRMTAQRIMEETTGFSERLELAYRLCLHRTATSTDREIANQFFASHDGSSVNENATPDESLDQWHQYVAALFASTEFRLLD